MSAYIVADATINRCVTWLLKAHHDGAGGYEIDRLLAKYQGYTSVDVEQMAVEMFTLNCLAVNERYEDRPAEAWHPEAFVFQWEPCASEVQVLK